MQGSELQEHDGLGVPDFSGCDHRHGLVKTELKHLDVAADRSSEALKSLRVISTAAIKRSESMKPHRLTFRAPWESPPRVRASGGRYHTPFLSYAVLRFDYHRAANHLSWKETEASPNTSLSQLTTALAH